MTNPWERFDDRQAALVSLVLTAAFSIWRHVKKMWSQIVTTSRSRRIEKRENAFSC
jgi:uncharacterized membrane-anchored protein